MTPLLHLLAEPANAGPAALAHERQAHQGGDAGVRLVLRVGIAAVGILASGEVIQRRLDHVPRPRGLLSQQLVGHVAPLLAAGQHEERGILSRKGRAALGFQLGQQAVALILGGLDGLVLLVTGCLIRLWRRLVLRQQRPRERHRASQRHGSAHRPPPPQNVAGRPSGLPARHNNPHSFLRHHSPEISTRNSTRNGTPSQTSTWRSLRRTCGSGEMTSASESRFAMFVRFL